MARRLKVERSQALKELKVLVGADGQDVDEACPNRPTTQKILETAKAMADNRRAREEEDSRGG